MQDMEMNIMFCLMSSYSIQCILDDALENFINLSPCRIRIHLPAEDDIDCVVPCEISVSKAYKVCYISM